MNVAVRLRVLLMALSLSLGACGTPAPILPAATATLDACDPAIIASVIQPMNELMLQFDDYATLAQYRDKSELPRIVANMQSMQELSQQLIPPACLQTLHDHQLAYMDATMSTLLEFQKADPSTGTIATAVVDAQRYHQEYVLELNRLLAVAATPVATPLP